MPIGLRGERGSWRVAVAVAGVVRWWGRWRGCGHVGENLRKKRSSITGKKRTEREWRSRHGSRAAECVWYAGYCGPWRVAPRTAQRCESAAGAGRKDARRMHVFVAVLVSGVVMATSEGRVSDGNF